MYNGFSGLLNKGYENEDIVTVYDLSYSVDGEELLPYKEDGKIKVLYIISPNMLWPIMNALTSWL